MSWFRRLLRTVKGSDTGRDALPSRRGDDRAAEGSTSEPSAAYKEAKRLGEFDRAACLKLAETYFDAYQPQEARDTLRGLVDAAPGDGETYRDVIKICLRRDDQSSLREAIKKGVALETKDASYYLLKSCRARFKYMYQLDEEGQPLSEEMREAALEEMREAAEQSIALDPTNSDTYYFLGEGLYWKYFSLSAPGGQTPEQHDEVIRALEKSVELDPRAPLAVSLLGHAYSDAGRYEEAIAAYQRRLRLWPLDNAPQFLIARSYAHLGRFQDAVDAMRKALEWQQGMRIGLGEHRWSMEALKSVEESKDSSVSLRRSACLFASYASALFSRTAYKWDSPRMGGEAAEDCLRWYEKALSYPAGEPDPLEWQAHLHAGAEYLRLERYDEARAALLKSAALRPEAYADHEVAEYECHPQPLEWLAECYTRMGLSEQAREALHRHAELIRRACGGLRERLDALEAQPSASDTPSRLHTLSFLLGKCEEYEAKAARGLAQMSGEIGGD